MLNHPIMLLVGGIPADESEQRCFPNERLRCSTLEVKQMNNASSGGFCRNWLKGFCLKRKLGRRK